MRAAFSLLALVIVAALVLSLAKRQATALKPPAGASAPAAQALPQPEAVRQQVDNAMKSAARATENAASAGAD